MDIAEGNLAEAQMLRLVVGPAGFGCGNLPYFAVALAEAELDCRVRVHEPSGAGFTLVAAGEITNPGPPHYNAELDRRAEPGETIAFEVTGPDAKAALPILREAFAKGTENRLAVLRAYLRLQSEVEPGMQRWDTGMPRWEER